MRVSSRRRKPHETRQQIEEKLKKTAFGLALSEEMRSVNIKSRRMRQRKHLTAIFRPPKENPEGQAYYLAERILRNQGFITRHLVFEEILMAERQPLQAEEVDWKWDLKHKKLVELVEESRKVSAGTYKKPAGTFLEEVEEFAKMALR